MKPTKKTNTKNQDFELNDSSFLPKEEYLHKYNNNIICITDSKGYPQPNNKDLFEIRVDSSNGFIPLWEKGVIINWRFSKSFGSYFVKPEAAKTGVRKLLGEAISAWQDACPVKFHEDNDAWDFEIAMHQKNCNDNGCVLASAFFPDPGQNIFYIYPTMFEQDHQEQVETMEHEIGHVFGLRHFFANISEREWSSELFETDSAFSIMNYGDKSRLTVDDIKDLKILYELVWSGKLTEINGTEIKLFKSYHMSTWSLVHGVENSSSPSVLKKKDRLTAKYLGQTIVLDTINLSPLYVITKAISLLTGKSQANIILTSKLSDLGLTPTKKAQLRAHLNEHIQRQYGSSFITEAEMSSSTTVADLNQLVESKIP